MPQRQIVAPWESLRARRVRKQPCAMTVSAQTRSECSVFGAHDLSGHLPRSPGHTQERRLNAEVGSNESGRGCGPVHKGHTTFIITEANCRPSFLEGGRQGCIRRIPGSLVFGMVRAVESHGKRQRLVTADQRQRVVRQRVPLSGKLQGR
jgi:hypothetical protein